jgi:hypothetical protein
MMAKNSESLYYDPDDNTISVRVTDLDQAKLEAALEFCESEDNPGEFDWNYVDNDEGEPEEVDFFFNDPNTAFAFKMRFG